MKRIRYALLPLIAWLCIPHTAQAQAQSANPYTLQQVVTLLEGGWSSADILPMVRSDCISFRVTSQAEATLRRAGADDSLLTGLRSVCNRASGIAPARPGPSRPPAQGVVLIEGELPPGWTRIVNELAPNTNRTITLTPGRPAVIVVAAPGWCPDRIDLTLRAGEEHRWTPSLRARPWVGGC